MTHQTDDPKGKYEVEDSTENAMAVLAGETNKVKNDSNDHKYFIITPRIVKAYSRTPYDLALWDTIKDIAGDAGECYLSTWDLATLSGMSSGQVHLSRKYWIKLGFLKGEVKRDPGYPQSVWHLSVPDLWQKNIAWCEKHPKIQDRIAFKKEHKSLYKKSVHPVNAKKERSLGEQGTTPGELKNTTKDLVLNVNERAALLTKLYKENIGGMVPLMISLLRNAAIDYPDSTWYEPAFEIAVKGNGRSWNFVAKVLQNWKEHGRGWSPVSQSYRGNGSKKHSQSSAPEVKYDYDALRKQVIEYEAQLAKENQ